MLVLSRRCNERIVFPTLGISVEVRRVAGTRVHLAIDAPSNIRIYRQELLERKSLEGPYHARPRRPR
jgi:carbon storage regulator CsrA